MSEIAENEFDEVTGFNKKGIHKDTNERYDLDGYDYKGYDKSGYNKYGYKRDGTKRNTKNEELESREKKGQPTKENDRLYIYNGANARG